MNSYRFTFPRSIIKVAFLFLVFLPGIASAAGYLKIGSIKGESRDSASGHQDWIVIESVSFGTARAPTPNSVARSSADLSDVSISKSMDASSPQLQQACANGTRFPEAELHMEREGGISDKQEYIAYKLTNVMVTCTSSDGQPTENITLSFERMEVEYVAADNGQVAPATNRAAPGIRPQSVTPRPQVQGVRSNNRVNNF